MSRCVAILILCISFPILAFGNTLETREAAMTKNDIFAIRDAFKFYHKEYGYFPPPDLALIVNLLRGQDLRGYNWRKIVFWEPRSTEKWLWITTRQGNIDEQGTLLDGWGRPFHFAFDPQSQEIEMWSLGKEGLWDKSTAQSRDLYWKIKQGSFLDKR